MSSYLHGYSKGKRPSPRQYVAMLQYMERYGDLSCNFRNADNSKGKSKLTIARHWADLTLRLNSMKGTEKSLDEWRKAWSDWKNNTRKKHLKVIKRLTGIGLSNLEKRIIKIAGNNYIKNKNLLSNADQERATEMLHDQSEPVDDSTGLFTPEEEESDGGDDPPHVKLESSWPPHADNQNRNLEIFEPSLDERRREREEELHRLRVAERVWALKTLREKHAIVQIEKRRAQLELEWREWEIKCSQEKHAAAQLEREYAQLQRDLALLELQRAQRGQALHHNTLH